MIYLYYGTDTAKARHKAQGLVQALQQKKQDASYFRHTAESLNEGALDELIQGQGLFERKYIVFMDTVLEDAEKKELILEKIEPLKESENIFVVLEKKLDAKSKKAFEKWSEKIQIYDETDGEKAKRAGNEFNIFDLTSALSIGNTKKAWAFFDEARRRELKAEEIHGVLWWYAKKTYSKNQRDEKAQKNLFEMMSMYHEAHRGTVDFMRVLEKWILKS